MYFKKLDLLGFKSFQEKTTLHFEPGITAIVGPNGCGKSNIFDSIRWVLGEQSAKSLRGSDMQDVIFNGTDSKEALSMAEVTLTFDNQNKFFNIDHPELAITRRLFRSGESEYLINKANVRLKDILDLLMGTGIGAESYSIIAQGKIDLVLSSRPEDRRLVFDEASGITKYKSQKREATRRLDETEQNLLRVNDIVTEVKRQIGSLERQANKARRYKEVFEELKIKETNLAIIEKRNFLKEKEESVKKLSELEASELNLQAQIKEEESKISSRQSELKVLEDSIMEIKNRVLNLENIVVRNNEHIKFNQDRITELAATKIYLQEQLTQAKEKLVLDEDKLNKVREEYNSIKGDMEAKGAVLLENETQIAALAASIKSSLENIAIHKTGIMDLVSKIATTKNEISDFTSKQQIFMARKKRLEIEKAKVYEEKAITQDSLKNITLEVESIKKTVDELTQKISSVKSNSEDEKIVLAQIDTSITELERQKLTLESQKEFLEKLRTKYEDIGETLNATIFLDKLPSEKTSGLVIKIKDYAASLSDDDKAYFEAASFKLSGEAKPIELDTQKITEKLARLEQELNILKDKKQHKEKAIGELLQSIQALEQELRNHEISFANKETSRQTVLEQFNKIKEEEDIIVLELSDVQKEISVLENNITLSSGHLADLNKIHRETEDAILKEEDGISLNNKLREGVLMVITQTKAELQALTNRVSSDEATLRLLEDTFAHDQEALNNIERQMEDSVSKENTFTLEIKDCELKVSDSTSEIQAQNESLKSVEERYQVVSESGSDVVKKIEDDRKQLDEMKNKVYELQMYEKDIDYKYSTIKTRMQEAYKIDLEVIEDNLGELDYSLLSEEINRLKEKLDSYGTVNLVAIEEYDELKKRYDFLIQQQTDLVSAKEALHQAILKINRTTKEMFMETFEKVKLEFRNYFKMLFNGGDAQLFLIDENDPLESGIEIICRPPGKKLQNVLLLSGGEKSMSAIALIFAIFKVKPSPFCVLDEIDAALDEANVDRFSRALQEFSKTSQFIVVTHNKKTIANASVMYGITMQESGVSKIVSVKFAKGEQEKDKEPEAVAEPV